jgi:hypothetical protein
MNSNPNDPNALLMGGGGRSAFTKDDPVGTVVGGTITELKTAQQTDFKTGVPKTWDNGDPMMQVIVTVQTDKREDERDDGLRNFYLKGGAKREDTTQGAVVKACREVHAPGLTIGGTLSMAFIGTEPSQGGSDRKRWAAKYEPPVMPVGDADPFGSTSAAADPFAATPTPQPATPAADPFATQAPGF